MKLVEDIRERPILSLVLAVVCGWIWIAPPQALLPGEPELTPEEQMENRLRMDLFRTATAVEEFYDSAGHLPAALEEAGLQVERIRYQVLSDRTYRLESRPRELEPISWVSSEGVGAIIAPVILRR